MDLNWPLRALSNDMLLDIVCKIFHSIVLLYYYTIVLFCSIHSIHIQLIAIVIFYEFVKFISLPKQKNNKQSSCNCK